MGSQKEQHTVDVLVVRWKRLRALPNCRGSEQVLEASSLTFAGKFSQFDPWLVHRQIPMPVLMIHEAVTRGAVGCEAKHFLQQALVCVPNVDGALFAECRLEKLWSMQSLPRLDHTQKFSVISSQNVFLFFFTDLRSDDFCKLCSH